MNAKTHKLKFASPINDQDEISRFWRLWLPLLVAIGTACFHYVDSNLADDLLFTEGTGLYEVLHMLIPLAGSAVALIAFFSVRSEASPQIWVYLLILAAGCFYIAGEEMSWGQHFFGWATPEGWAEMNRQQETNLHNVSSWFNHKPRLVLNIAVFVASVIVPIAIARRLS